MIYGSSTKLKLTEMWHFRCEPGHPRVFIISWTRVRGQQDFSEFCAWGLVYSAVPWKPSSLLWTSLSPTYRPLKKEMTISTSIYLPLLPLISLSQDGKLYCIYLGTWLLPSPSWHTLKYTHTHTHIWVNCLSQNSHNTQWYIPTTSLATLHYNYWLFFFFIAFTSHAKHTLYQVWTFLRQSHFLQEQVFSP